MKKIVLIVLLAGLGWWYFDGGRRMSETAIREHYREQLVAFNAYDAEPLCSGMDAAYKSTGVAYGPGGTRKASVDRDQACREITNALDTFRQLRDASRGLLRLTVDGEIKSIDLSPDRKSATVESVVTMKVGDRLVSRASGKDRLIRRLGRMRSLGGESKTWLY